jgi:molecular chaperone GrpE
MSTPRTQDERPDGPEADAPPPEAVEQDGAETVSEVDDGADDGSSPESASAGDGSTDGSSSDDTGGDEPETERDLEAELTEAKDRWLRARAELENVRRRARLDVEEAREYGTGDVLLQMLPVLDALQRGIAALPEGDEDPVLEGLRLTEQQFTSTLERLGVVAVAAELGTPMDPECHRALVEQPTDEHPPGTIVAEISRGYRLRDRLLRESEVVVAKATE